METLSEDPDLPRRECDEKGELSTGRRRRLALGCIGVSSGKYLGVLGLPSPFKSVMALTTTSSSCKSTPFAPWLLPFPDALFLKLFFFIDSLELDLLLFGLFSELSVLSLLPRLVRLTACPVTGRVSTDIGGPLLLFFHLGLLPARDLNLSERESISLLRSLMLIPLSLVAEELAVLACDLVPISLGSSDSGVVFLPLNDESLRLLLLENGTPSFLDVWIEFPSKFGKDSFALFCFAVGFLDVHAVLLLCIFVVAILLGRIWNPLYFMSDSVLDRSWFAVQSYRLFSLCVAPVAPVVPVTFSSDLDLLLDEDLLLLLREPFLDLLHGK